MGSKDGDTPEMIESKKRMRKVLDIILNHSEAKFGMQNGSGRTYEAFLTVDSIERAQMYYKLLCDIKNGKDELKISDEVTKAYPDFPKFAITYSLSENEEKSHVNQNEMSQSLSDYNKLFGTHYEIENIQAYNKNLNERLARKEKKYLKRDQQLDLVIVVDRLLTGFDAPCLSTLFIDRPPMKSQNLIQAFSRTNRLFDDKKMYGQIVTFQEPEKFKNAINIALKLYSMGGYSMAISEDWDTVLQSFSISVCAIHKLARTPEEIVALSQKQKKTFIQLFRSLDHDFAHLKAFSKYDETILQEHDFSEKEYENYAAMYKNVMEEFRKDKENPNDTDPVMDDYDLIAYDRLRIDFEYLLELLQGFIESLDPSQNDFKEVNFEADLKTIRGLIDEFSKDNQKLSELLNMIVDEIEADKSRYIGQDISVIVNQMRYEAIDREVAAFSKKWFLNPEEVRYEVFNFKDGKLANETNLKEKADYTAYKNNTDNPMSKFRFWKEMIEDFKNELMSSVQPLL